MNSKAIQEQYPVSISLRFRDQRQKDWFMAQLSDGYGEAFCGIEWPHETFSRSDVESGKAFESCDVFGVEVFDGEEEERG